MKSRQNFIEIRHEFLTSGCKHKQPYMETKFSVNVFTYPPPLSPSIGLAKIVWASLFIAYSSF